MTGARRPVVVVLHRAPAGGVVDHGTVLPPRLDEIEQLAEVRPATVDTFADAVVGADVLYQWHSFSPALRENWDAASSVRWVHVSAAGVSALMFDELVRSDVVYTNSRGVLSGAIAEFVLGFVLDLAKDSPRSWSLQQQRTWRHRTSRAVAGQHAVVLGTGSIGRAIARLLTAVGMTVHGVGRTAREGDPDFGSISASKDLAAAVAGADHLVVAAPLTSQTRGLVDGRVLAAMDPAACVINVGRGEVVDTDALVAALSTGGLAGAALDVVDPEPLPADHPLWRMENVILTPHMSGDTEGYLDDLAALFTANLQRYIAGEPLMNVVDKQLGYVPGT